MATQELPMEPMEPMGRAEEPKVERRVVEAEIRLPKMQEIRAKLPEVKLPKVDMQPVRNVAGEVILTGLGIGVLMVRGIVYVVKAAHAAGVEASKNPGPVTRSLLNMVQGTGATGTQGGTLTRKVPVLPIDHYDTRSTAEVLVRLPDLSTEQLRVLRAYESAHENRAEVIQALDLRLSEA